MTCENKKEKFYKHINGLKGVACLFIMVGHYLGIYKYAQLFKPAISIIDRLDNSRFSFFISESYWLYLFFVISGYLIAKSKIDNINNLFSKSVNRFLRFALPVFFSYSIIYLIYVIIGFHNVETKKLFQCLWYQKFYLDVYSINEVIYSPFYVLLLGKCKLNSPYWVLQMMFFSSLLIYIIKYLYVKFENDNRAPYFFSILVIVTILSSLFSKIIMACFVGMLISFYENKDIQTKGYYAFWVIFLSMCIYIMSNVMKSTLFFAALIYYIPKINWINRIFSSKVFQVLGNISWGIYSFHWPFICSFGALSIIKFSKNIGLIKSYFITFFIVLILTIIISIFFYYTFERLSLYLIMLLNKRVFKLMKLSIKN